MLLTDTTIIIIFSPMVLYMQYSRIVDGDSEAVYPEVWNSQQAALMFKRVRWDSHDDTRYTKSTLSWRGEEAKSLVRAQVISHLEWIKKGREEREKEERGEKDWKGRDGQNLRTPHIMYEAWKKTGC